MSLSFLCYSIITVLLQHTISQTDNPSNCLTIYVVVIDTDGIDPSDWNGVYSLDETTTSFNAPIWRVENKWLKYIETSWVLSSSNDELLTYKSVNIFPPTGGIINIWKYEYNNKNISITLTCSNTLSPTSTPTNQPTKAPTHSPTPSQCDVLIVNSTNINNWFYFREIDNDITGRPIWKYSDIPNGGITESSVQYNDINGWTVTVIFNGIATIYSRAEYGYYPPLNVIVNLRGVDFLFTCLITDYPSQYPTKIPSNIPTSSPTNIPSLLPTNTPSSIPSIIPTNIPSMTPTNEPTPLICDALQIEIPNALIMDDIDTTYECIIDYNEVFSSYFLLQTDSQISNKPYWTIDCDDYNTDYSDICDDGYSAIIFYDSTMWTIRIHSKNDNCFVTFYTESNSQFIPQHSEWINVADNKEYEFNVICGPYVPATTNSQFNGQTKAAIVNNETIKIFDTLWFWIVIVLLLVLLCLCILMIFFYKKQQQRNKNEDKNELNIELQQPIAGHIDQNIASPANMHKESGELDIEYENDDEKENEALTSNITNPNPSDPNINPNLGMLNRANTNDGTNTTPNGGTMVAGSNNGENNDKKNNNKDVELELAVEDMIPLPQEDNALDILAGPPTKKPSKHGVGYIAESDSENSDLQMNV